MTEPASQPDSPRWYHPRPGHFVVLLLVVEGVLWLSERYRWFPFNEHKNWTVLIAVAAVGGFLATMFLWFLAALVFRVRFQFSLRSLITFVTLCALPCSWLAVKKQQAKAEREAAIAITELGGSVDWSAREAKGPKWLRGLLGDDFFVSVKYVSLARTQVTDQGLEHLRGLGQLKALDLCGTQVTDKGLEHLSGLGHLLWLNLSGAHVGNTGIETLKGFGQLEILNLGDTQVTDQDLEHLKGLSKLEWLGLEHTQVTDNGLKKLKQALPDCQIIM